MDIDDETWLLDAGDIIVAKKTSVGFGGLKSLERLVYCLWVADYGMRNAGDLAAADDVFESFLEDGQAAAQDLGLAQATAAFSLSRADLEQRYFELFDPMISEIRTAWSDGGLQ